MSHMREENTWFQAVSVELDTHNGDPPFFPLSAMRIQIFAPLATIRTVHNNGFPFPPPLLFFCPSSELQKHHLHPSSNSDPPKSEASQSMAVA